MWHCQIILLVSGKVRGLGKKIRPLRSWDYPWLTHNWQSKTFIYYFWIIGGVTRYYETKRQQHLDTLPERLEAAEKKNYEKKLTSRRRRVSIFRSNLFIEAGLGLTKLRIACECVCVCTGKTTLANLDIISGFIHVRLRINLSKWLMILCAFINAFFLSLRSYLSIVSKCATKTKKKGGRN